jgi:hypothetical protein
LRIENLSITVDLLAGPVAGWRSNACLHVLLMISMPVPRIAASRGPGHQHRQDYKSERRGFRSSKSGVLLRQFFSHSFKLFMFHVLRRNF